MTTSLETGQQIDEASVRTMVAEWYRALDRHDPLDEVLPYLVDDGLEMRFPEETSRGHDGFAAWYERVTRIFFDEEHTVTDVTFVETTDEGAGEGGAGEGIVLKVDVNWQAHIWNAPEPRSQWIGFDAHQTWVIVPGPSGTPQVKTYIVDSLDPMPGSPAL